MAWQAFNKTSHSIKLAGVVDRTKQDVIAARVAGCGVGSNFNFQKCNEIIVNRLVNQNASRCRAVLAGIEETGDGDLRSRLLQVCIGTDNDRGLATQLKVHSLQISGRRLGNFHSGAN